MPRGIPSASLNFISLSKVEKMEAAFLLEKLVQLIISASENAMTHSKISLIRKLQNVIR